MSSVMYESRLGGSLEHVRTEADRMHFAIDMERGNDRSPAQEEVDALEAMADTGIRRVEQLLDGGTTAQVLRLTPNEWREMGPHQRRALLDWTVARIKALEEKAAFMSRNIVFGDIETPPYLRSGGVK